MAAGWQLREINGRFHRLPPKDDSYRSTNWEPCLPVDLPEFLAVLVTGQIDASPHQRCACAGQHGGSGHYVFLGPDGGHYRRSNYARRVFRPACDGRNESTGGRPARLVIADTTVWPGVPVAMWPSAQPAAGPDARTDADQRTDFHTAPWPRHPDNPGRHPAHLLAPTEARPDAARIETQPHYL